jgi:hypothetical protein
MATERSVPARASAAWSPWAPALRVVVAAGLAVDAYVHADLAASYADAQSLFLVEAGVALGAALLVLAGGRTVTVLFAALVAASALIAVVASRYVDVGPIGPVPDLYEPAWYPEKVVAATAEATALVAALLLACRRPR